MKNIKYYQLLLCFCFFALSSLNTACTNENGAKIKGGKKVTDGGKGKLGALSRPEHMAALPLSAQLLALQSLAFVLEGENSNLLDRCIRVSPVSQNGNLTKYALTATPACNSARSLVWTGELLLSVNRKPCNCADDYFIHTITGNTDSFGFNADYIGSKKILSNIVLTGNFQIRQFENDPYHWEYNMNLNVSNQTKKVLKNGQQSLYAGHTNIDQQGSLDFQRIPNKDFQYSLKLADAELSSTVEAEYRSAKGSKRQSSLVLNSSESLQTGCMGRTNGNFIASFGGKNTILKVTNARILNTLNRGAFTLSSCKPSQLSLFYDFGKVYESISDSLK